VPTDSPEAIALRAWQQAFGTTQLTHAKARLEAAEKAAQSATPASDALRRLSEDVMRCIDASWKPGYARDYGNLGPILAEYIDDLRKSAIPAAFNAPAGWHPDEPDAPPPASAASFEAIRDAIAIRMSGHTISEHDGKAWDTFMFLLRAVKASECAVSETPPSGTAKVPEGWIPVGTSDVPPEGHHVLVYTFWDKCIWTAYTQNGKWHHANGDGSNKYVLQRVVAWMELPPSPDGN
jgi:hypothetical protein